MKNIKFTVGFTLIELLITIAIAVVLLTLAAPELRGLIAGNRVSSHQADLHSALNLARSEAITRGLSVGVCGRANANACVANGDWSAGWLVFIDNGAGLGGNNSIRDADEEILRDYINQGPNRVVIDDNDFAVFMRFDPRGLLVTRVTNIADGPIDQRVTLKICGPDNDVEMAEAIIVGQTGRVRQSFDVAPANNVSEDADGDDIVCP